VPALDMRILTTSLLLLLLIGTSSSDDSDDYALQKSGRAFRRVCIGLDEPTPATNLANGTCLGFIVGIFEGMTLEQSILAVDINLKVPPPAICKPDNVSTQQIARITLKYIKEHPEKEEGRTAELMYEAMDQAFPCKKDKK